MNDIIFIILVIIMLIIFFILMKYLFQEYHKSYIEKRFTNYSLNSFKDKETPFFEIIYRLVKKTLKKITVFLKKNTFLKKYSLRYEKYISFDNIESIEPLDFVSTKILIGLFVGILYSVCTIIQNNFNGMTLLLFIIIGFIVPDLYFYLSYKNRKKLIEKNLLSAIIMMNNSFKSGMNIVQAVDIVKNELVGPISDEFKKISLDISYGLSLEVAFQRFYKRVGIEEAKYITSSLSLINKTGGNIVKVFDAIEKTFYDEKKLKDEMNSLTSSSVFMFRLLVFMPIVLIIVIFSLNNSFFSPLITTKEGRMIILLILLLYIIYIFVVKKIMKVNINE